MAKLTREDILARAKTLLDEANKSLKIIGSGLRLEIKGESVCIRGVLPSRNPSKPQPYRQRLSLGLKFSPAAIAKAESFAKKMTLELINGTFDWGNYINDSEPDTSTKTCGDWIKEYEVQHKPDLKPTSWKKSYQEYFSRLPKDEPLTLDILMATYNKITGKRAMQMGAIAYRKLAEFAGIKIEFPKVRIAKIDRSKREIPSDDAIVAAWESIPNPKWKNAFAVLATYGIRPHELHFLDFDDFPILNVTDGKTGARSRVYPLHREWAELFNLKDAELPEVNDFGDACSHRFRSYRIPFPPYTLRHAYAIRGTVDKKISHPTMSRMMGHSSSIHLDTYNAWISDSQIDQEMMSLGRSPD